MKRKVKLFTSIASLCLAVALMAFGVYAATNVEYTATGSVSFESYVAVTWEATATGGLTSQPATTAGSYVTHADGSAATGTNTWDADRVFGAATGEQVIVYTIKCTNNGTDPVDVSYVENAMIAEQENVLSVEAKCGKKGELTTATPDAVTLTKGQIYEYVLTVTLEDVSASLGSEGLSFNLKFTAAKGTIA